MTDEKTVKISSKEARRRVKEFGDDPSNFVDGPKNITTIHKLVEMKYATVSKHIQFLDLRRNDKNATEEEKFAPWVKVIRTGNGLWVWCHAYDKEQYTKNQ